jgi:DNA adenine methylase
MSLGSQRRWMKGEQVTKISEGSTFTPVAPLLRWAGGKRWLLPQLRALTGGRKFNSYHEPFFGGGSVFFGLDLAQDACLRDLNVELIEAYGAVRDNPRLVAEALKTHINTSEHYYALRQATPQTAESRAARLIFLNHTSYNGIYRVNLNGQYNVPYGARANPILPDEDRLVRASEVLKRASLHAGDFADCHQHIEPGALVFLDPPYTVAHNHNGFVKYNQKLFSYEDQERLSALVDTIRERNAYYVLTNAAHDSIRKLFSKGDRMIETSRRNSIGGSRATRGSAQELLFTNLDES